LSRDSKKFLDLRAVLNLQPSLKMETNVNFAAGKWVLVTGSTDGLGKETARQLAKQGSYVILHGRNREKVASVKGELQSELVTARFETVAADFESLSEVEQLAREINERFPTLQILINNAGIYNNRRELSRDGYETTLAVNHLAPFLLTTLLLELLKRNAPSRIINVASTVHQGAELDFENLQLDRGFSGYAAYSTSKLANVLFTYELAERLRGSAVSTYCLHPGGVATKLLRAGFGGGGIPVSEGAKTQVYLATAPEIRANSGQYFARSQPERPDERAHDSELRKKLWTVSENLIDRRSRT